MKTANRKHVTAAGLLLILGMVGTACAPKLNPAFNDSLAAAMNERKADFRSCFKQALQKQREAQGDMRLMLRFKPESKQAYVAQVLHTDIADEQMKQCVSRAAQVVTTTQAPGVKVDAKYTVNFSFK